MGIQTCICWWENVLPGGWDMSRRKPIKEFPTAQGKQRLRRANCVTHRNGRLEVRRPREINVSEGKDLLLFTGDPFVSYSDTRRRNIGYFPSHKFYYKFQYDFPSNKIYVPNLQYNLKLIKF